MDLNISELDDNHYGKLSRTKCSQCLRPEAHCWCQFLPHPPLNISGTVVILQHPTEVKRPLRTAPMIYHGLEKGKCHILSARRFNLDKEKFQVLKDIINCNNTYLLYPSSEAVSIDSVAAKNDTMSVSKINNYNLIAIDGTWANARGIYNNNAFLHSIKKIQLEPNGCSEYVIRTQPTDTSLSTVESIAIALSHLEKNRNIHSLLIKPMKQMCEYQIAHGAVVHQSKQFLEENGLPYKKQMKRKVMLAHGLLVDDV